jgi:hypothetical protein
VRRFFVRPPACILVLNLSSSRNVPGHGVYMYPNMFAPSEQPQAQVGHSRHGPPQAQGPPPPPPRNMPVQPTFSSDYASIPRALVDPYQQGTGHVNNQVNDQSRPAFLEAFPQAHPHARASHTQTPLYGGYDFANPGGQEPPPYSPAPAPSQSLTPRGLPPYGRPSSGGPYELVHPPVFGRPPPSQMYVSQTA